MTEEKEEKKIPGEVPETEETAETPEAPAEAEEPGGGEPEDKAGHGRRSEAKKLRRELEETKKALETEKSRAETLPLFAPALFIPARDVRAKTAHFVIK